MHQGAPQGSGSRRRTQFVVAGVIVTVLLAATALVTWLVVVSGLEFWVFLLLLVTIVFVVLAIAD